MVDWHSVKNGQRLHLISIHIQLKITEMRHKERKQKEKKFQSKLKFAQDTVKLEIILKKYLFSQKN